MYPKSTNQTETKCHLLTAVLSLMLVQCFWASPVFAQGGADTPQAKNAGSKADQNLKSLAKVNPSTLAMEMNVPLFSYPGRNGNALTVGISYSSKLWRMKNGFTYHYDTPIEEYRQYVTQVWPLFAERSAAGWTSSLSFPTIEEKIDEWYTEEGKAFPNTHDINAFDYWTANSVPPSSNLLEDETPRCCRLMQRICWNGTNDCGPWTCVIPDLGCLGGGGAPTECQYQNGYCPASCSFCTEQPQCPQWNPNCGSVPTPQPTPETPPKMHYVKRVSVRMGDGSLHEFRKSDGVYGHCGGGNPQNDGPDCEPIDPDFYGTFLSVDGSGMKLHKTLDGSTLYLPDGGRYEFMNRSTGIFDKVRMYQATDYFDSAGNHSTFGTTQDQQQQFAGGGQPQRKMTDALGREIADPLPLNLTEQAQQEGIQAINLPGFGTNGTQSYKLRWLHLKPVPCTTETTTNCGAQEGALENQGENLYFYSAKTCFGSSEVSVDPNNLYPGEIMFPSNGIGIRSCNPGTGGTASTNQPLRFNPVVLAGIEMPNGKTYEFKYNQFGEITKIVYPTGSYETFVYAKIRPLSASAGEPAYNQTNRGVVEQKVYDSAGVLQRKSTYSVSTGTYPNNVYTVTSTISKANDPVAQGAKNERYLVNDTRDDSYFGFNDPTVGMPYEERSYDENNVLRFRTLNDWIIKGPIPTNDSLRPANPEATRDPRSRRSITITIENGKALAVLSEKEYETPGENGSTAPTDPEYFAHLNVKRSKSHHYRNIPMSLAQTGTIEQIAAYFSSSSVAAISETDYLYDQNYMGRGIYSLPIETRSINPNDNSVQAKTQTKYDNLLPNITTGYDYTVENHGISGNYDCGMAAPKKCWVDPASAYLGRPTTSRLWNKDGNTWIESHTKYDIFGDAVKAKDPVGNEASTTFSPDYKYAYPTRVDTPIPDPDGVHGTNQGSFSTTTYDFMTGLPLTATDEFGQTTATEYNDPLLRPTRTYAVNFAAPESQTVYDDNARTVKVRKQIDATNWDEATTFADSLGRTIKTVAKDSQGDVIVETKYDLLGRVQMVTNPYRQGETVFWSLTEYDEAGRAKQTREPVANQNPASPTGNILGITSYDLSTMSGYLGAAVTTTDAAGRKGRSITNALGQLIVVEEPDSDGNLTALPSGTPQPSPTPTPGGGGDPPPDCLMPEPPCGVSNLAQGEYPSYATYYRYDTLGKMVEVTQGVQKRWFKYDSLGRLIRVRQPEQEVNTALNLNDEFNTSGQWTAGFTYDILGNVLTATDANGTTITNAYDRAGRVKTRTYSDSTPAVSFYYDGKGLSTPQTPNYAKGKLTKVTSSVSATEYQLFDNLGRMTQMAQITDGHTYTSKYTYNFSGALIEEEYPSGRKVKNDFESDGDLLKVTSQKNSSSVYTPYASNFSYTASGGISQMRLGNGRWETAKFNTRMQVTELGLGNGPADASLWKTNYEYGELDANGNVVASKNTGNIARQTLTVPGTSFVQSYEYDSLYRLKVATEKTGSTQNWTQSWNYDRFGNRVGFAQNVAGFTDAPNPTINENSNRFEPNQGFSYDLNGNLVVDNEGRQFTFNGDNKQTVVKDASNNVIGQYFYDGEGKRVKKITNSETTIFVYSSGKLVAEYSNQPSQTPTVAYTTTDHLGTPRVITDQFGQVKARRDFMPFGEDIFVNIGARTSALQYNSTTDDIRQKFTGYQKDSETQLDFAEARMYENRHGRFTAVDPLLASGKSANPQTFNRYVYVGNNPLTITDPLGLDWFYNGNRYEWFAEKPTEDGWNPVQFDDSGRYYYTGCRNEDCSESDRAVLKQAGGWDWAPIQLSIGFPGFSIPNPFALGDRIEGWKVGVPNFFKGLANIPIETPMVLGTPTSLNDFGVNRFFEYGTYRNTTQRMAGAESQILLNVASLLIGGEGASVEASSIKGGQVFQRVVSNAELSATKSTSLLRGGRAGENFFTNAASLDAKRAQIRLGLDGPLRDQRITFRILDETPIFGPTRAKAGSTGTPGMGIEFFTNTQTKIEILRVYPLRK
ncbi:MAG: RHS repeat protein [Pyrinomonadaceae bacterium]|nr:RHS repeat protein [Pyrinomonadaceae bacterium]